MTYAIVTARINNDGTVEEGKRRMLHSSPVELNIGGLYFLGSHSPGKGKLYRIVKKIEETAR